MAQEKKIFVLDTSVIIYDHNAIKSFKEHDVVVPITVLEELDNFKKGNDTKNYAAREFTRYIDKISGRNTLQDWVNINGKGHGMFMIEMHQASKVDAEKIFGEKKLNTHSNFIQIFPNTSKTYILICPCYNHNYPINYYINISKFILTLWFSIN